MQVIVFAIPVFLTAIAFEIAVATATGRRVYRLNDAVNSLSLGVLSQVSGVFVTLLKIGIYTVVFSHVALFELPVNNVAVWLFALVAYDLCYYWNHRLGHTCAIFWAAHVVHHQSEDYNLSTALRQPTTGVLLSWIFYLPLAVLGVPPLAFAVVGLIDLLYQFWVHTELVGKLGWFDRIFCSPSNHRVHHAVNRRYLDKNYGGILMIWDRLFGSFVEERETPIFGVRPRLASWDPVWANFEVYWELARRSFLTRRWQDKIKVWFAPPSWKPADLANEKLTPFVGRRYDPPATALAQGFAVAVLVAMIFATAGFLWVSESLDVAPALVVLAAIVAALWAAGAALQSRVSLVEGLFILAAAFACAAQALGQELAFDIAKPAATGLAALSVLLRDHKTLSGRLTLAALLASLAGDVLLLRPEMFVFGLAAFLLAHLLYIALMTRDAPFLPSKRAAAAALVYGGAMLIYLWPGVDAGLKLPVVVYAFAISTMLAQAVGRAIKIGDGAAWAVAFGAAFFVVSDTCLALTTFAGANTVVGLAVMPTYWLAQALISFYALPRVPPPSP